MDNAKIHHGEEIQDLVDWFRMLFDLLYPLQLIVCIGVRIEYLPAYSPNLNPLEEVFSKIKHFLRRHGRYYAEGDEGVRMWDLYEVMYIITASDACGYFLNAGYF